MSPNSKIVEDPNIVTDMHFEFDIYYNDQIRHARFPPRIYILPKKDKFLIGDHHNVINLKASAVETTVKMLPPTYHKLLPKNQGGSCINPEDSILKVNNSQIFI